MPAWGWVIVVVMALAAVAFLALRVSRSRRTEGLRDRFGSEYDHVVDETGDRREAETELAARVERREALDIRSLTPEERQSYAEAWERAQATFVDSPQAAIVEADALVRSVMQARGYPVAETEQRMADLSVDHPDVMDHFRLGTAIAGEARDGRATTERLRQAMIHFRSLFGRLLAEDDPAAGDAP